VDGYFLRTSGEASHGWNAGFESPLVSKVITIRTVQARCNQVDPRHGLDNVHGLLYIFCTLWTTIIYGTGRDPVCLLRLRLRLWY